MLLVALLLVNALAVSRLDARLLRDEALATGRSEGLWRRRRVSARVTAVLWVALVLSGSALAAH